MGKMKLNNFQDASDLKPIAKILAEGEASFLLRKVYNTNKEGHPLKSSKGDDMISLQFSVVDKNGEQGTLYDYMTCNTLFKIHNLCEAIGRPELYQPDFDYDQIAGCTGKLNIMVEDRPGQPRRNSVKSYVKFKAPAPSKYATPEQLAALDSNLDEVPF